MSIKNEVFICANTFNTDSNYPTPEIGNPSTPPSSGSGESIGDDSSSPSSSNDSGGSTSSSTGGLDSTGTTTGSGSGNGSDKPTSPKKPPSGGYVSCCEYSENIIAGFDCQLSLIAYCSEATPRVTIGASLAIRKNPLTCKGANLQAYLMFGGNKYSFSPWIGIGTKLVSMSRDISINPKMLNAILNQAEGNGGKSRIGVLINGTLNSNISDQCRDEKVKSKRISFYPDAKIKYVNWNGSGYSSEDTAGPHCVGTIDGCNGGKCPAKCCECCETVGQDLLGSLIKPTTILVYSESGGTYIFRKEDNPCNDRTPVDTIIEKNLYTCPFDCECNNDQKDKPKLIGSGVKAKISCERGPQTCYQCVLVEEGDCIYYVPLMSNSLPLSLEDLINQNLTN